MEPFDVVKNIRSCFILRAVIFGVDPFSFHHTKKSLTGRSALTVGAPSFWATAPASPSTRSSHTQHSMALLMQKDCSPLLPSIREARDNRLRACSARLLVCRACQRGIGDAVYRNLCGICGSANRADRSCAQRASAIHADVAAELQRVGTFASAFPTVVSLNYALTLYWAMLLFNAAHGSWFKDAFHDGEFQTDWEYLRRPYGHAAGATLVFYPHGSLAVARDYLGDGQSSLLAREPQVNCLAL